MGIFGRAQAREAALWPAFKTGLKMADAAMSFRDGSFSLFAKFSALGVDYYRDISTVELEQIATQYQLAMEELDAEDQRFVIDVAAREYLMAVDDAVGREGLRIKEQRVVGQDSIMDSREQALRADEANLLTMQAQLAAATAEKDHKIDLLESQISQEGVSLSLAEIGIKEAELSKLRQDASALRAAGSVLSLKVQTNRSAMELAAQPEELDRVQKEIVRIQSALSMAQADTQDFDHRRLMVDDQIASAQADIAGYDAKILSQTMQKADLEADTANYKANKIRVQTQVAEIEEQIVQYDNRMTQVEVQKAELQADIAGYESRITGVDNQLAGLRGEIASWNARSAQVEASIVETNNRLARLAIDTTRAGIRRVEAEAGKTAIEAEQGLKRASVKMIEADSDAMLAEADSTTSRADSMQIQAVSKKKDGTVYVKERVSSLKYDKANLESRVTEMERQKAQAGLTAKEIPVERAWTEATKVLTAMYQAEKILYQSAGYLSILRSVTSGYSSFIDGYPALETKLLDVATSGLDLRTLDKGLDASLDTKATDFKIAMIGIERAFVDREVTYEELVSAAKMNIWEKKEYASNKAKNAAIDAAELMSRANVTTSLIHQIGAAR